jgi:ribosomal-protein-alanine N-acetyltransferase
VNLTNLASIKILDKFMIFVKEFFNERDNWTNRTYELKKTNWRQRPQ